MIGSTAQRDASPTEAFVAATGTAWDRATRHAFTTQLAKDSLPDASFRWYLEQDFVFVDTLARFVAYAIAKAPTMQERRRLAGFLTILTGGENDYFDRALVAVGSSEAACRDLELDPVMKEFASLLENVGTKGSYEDIMTVLLAVEWVYLAWARPVAHAKPSRWYLREWIELHSSPEYEEFVEGWMRPHLDALASDASPPGLKALEARFVQVVELEAAFFDAALAQH